MKRFKIFQPVYIQFSTLSLLLLIASIVGGIIAVSLNNSIAYAGKQFRGEFFENLIVRGFTVIDHNDKIRAQLVADKDGNVGFALFDKEQRQRVSLKTNSDTSGIELNKNSGKSVVALVASDSGYRGIHLRANDGSTFSAGTKQGTPILVALTDENKRVRHAMGFDDKRTSYVMTGPSGDEANLIFMESDGSRGFSLTRRRSGGPIAVLGMDGDRPSLVLHDDNKSGLAMGYAANGEPGVLINRNGVPIWKAGAGSIRQSAPSVIDLIK